MSNRIRKSNNTSLFGLLIVLFGILLLMDRLIPGLFFLDWIFSWPMILIVIGIAIGAQSKYNSVASWILIGLGVTFLLTDVIDLRIGRLIWPMIIIAIGLYIITGRKRKRNRQWRYMDASTTTKEEPVWDKRVYDAPNPATDEPADASSTGQPENESKERPEDPYSTNDFRAYSRDFIDATSVFGNSKNFIVSKNFKGGDMVNIMGGSEINLMQADLQGPAILEVVQLFGGTTIVAPAHWIIVPEMAAIFGGVEDKRYSAAIPDKSKILYIKGTSLFGGITIKSL